MPFTFSHPAIVLPLIGWGKRFFSATGLIVGSMAPDFEYFITLLPYTERLGHSVRGIFLFDLPVALAVCFIFHNVVRNELIRSFPSFLNKRLSKFQSLNWNVYALNNPLIVIASILIGTASHLLWDSFTHNAGFFVRNYDFLNKRVFFISREREIRSILWEVSSLIGFATILLVVCRLKIGIETKDKNILAYWCIVILVATIVILLKNVNSSTDIRSQAVVSISGLTLGILVASLLKKYLFSDKILS